MVINQFDTSYEEVVHKRFTVAIGLDMVRGYSGEELVERTVNRYQSDDEILEFYDHDMDALEADISRYVEDYPVESEDMITIFAKYQASQFKP